MKLFIADVKRTDRGSYAVVQVIDVEKAKLETKTFGRNIYPPDVPLSCVTNGIIELVLSEKPDKIVFDEMGLGIALKDSFFCEIKKASKDVAFIEFNGSLVYPTK